MDISTFVKVIFRQVNKSMKQNKWLNGTKLFCMSYYAFGHMKSSSIIFYKNKIRCSQYYLNTAKIN